jgi:DNA-3-methyladenine glycosylase II
MTMRRFRVVEQSMLPALAPGDEFVASRSLRPKNGDIVAVPKPGRPDFWMVKRVAHHSGLAPGEIWVVSDNEGGGAVDSASFGPVPSGEAHTLVGRLDELRFDEAVDLLVAEDDALAESVSRHGRPTFWTRKEGFATLALLILEQQVSLESGAAVYRRLAEACGAVTPDAVLAAGETKLRSSGVTRQKAGYLLDLSERVTTGDLVLEDLAAVGPGTARARLTRIKGIGPWTADAYLLSALRLPDVFPLGDRALQVGAGEVLGLSHPPPEHELEMMALPWRPLRAVAARLIWHAYLDSRGRAEPVILV